MSYTAPRDFAVHPRKSLNHRQKKANRARRHRLNPGRRSVEEHRKEQTRRILQQFAEIGVC